ncbi:MAG: energy transducer TonB [Terriglobales bacterium]
MKPATPGCPTRLWIFVFVALLTAGSVAASAQGSKAPERERKVTRRVPPAYPQVARQARLSGKVRLVAVVAPNGSVKHTQPVGGNPVLLQSAAEAVMQWKYAPAPEETTEQVEIFFAPE